MSCANGICDNKLRSVYTLLHSKPNLMEALIVYHFVAKFISTIKTDWKTIYCVFKVTELEIK